MKYSYVYNVILYGKQSTGQIEKIKYAHYVQINLPCFLHIHKFLNVNYITPVLTLRTAPYQCDHGMSVLVHPYSQYISVLLIIVSAILIYTTVQINIIKYFILYLPKTIIMRYNGGGVIYSTTVISHISNTYNVLCKQRQEERGHTQQT